MATIANNLQLVRNRIQAACAQTGRPADRVTLLAVSKTFPAVTVRDAFHAGQRCFGENYVQEALDKIAELADLRAQITWHLIGPLQSNKTRVVAEHFDWVQSVDRLKIAQRLSEQRPEHLPPLQVCIQVNADGGPTKSGVMAEDALALAEAIVKLPNLVLRGIMSIPDDTPDFEAQCALHQRATAIFDAIKVSGLPRLEHFDTLSMGMTGDLEAAVTAGSTMVRVGSGIFGKRSYTP